MFVRRVLPAALAAILASGVASAQDLRDLLTNFIRAGVTLDADPICATMPTSPNCHVAHFEGAAIAEQVKAFQSVGTSIGQQLSSFPLPSSSGGFTYTYDPQRGTFTRGADSFGPIYSERADTVGQGRFNLGLNYSHFSYDQINGVDLSNGDMKLLFLHSTKGTGNFLAPWFRGDVIEGTLKLTVRSDITALVANYGVTDQFDVGLALPIESVSIKAETNLTIDHLATANDQDIHRFDCTKPGALNCSAEAETLKTSGSASGIGDLLLRAKYRLTSSPKFGIALGSDVRFPTGKEEDLLGTGVLQLKAFMIASAHIGVFSPHVNAGYTWAIHRCQGLSDRVSTDGTTTTSPRGDCRTTGSGGVPDEINYTGGFDVALGSSVTFVADLIGRTYRDTKIVGLQTRSLQFNTNDKCKDPASCAANPPILETTTKPFIGAQAGTGDINSLTGSVGFKVNPFGNFLVTINGLFSLNHNGLVDKFTPMIGFDYAF